MTRRIFSELPMIITHICGLMKEGRSSISNALELRLSCINPSIYPPPIHPTPESEAWGLIFRALLSDPCFTFIRDEWDTTANVIFPHRKIPETDSVNLTGPFTGRLLLPVHMTTPVLPGNCRDAAMPTQSDNIVILWNGNIATLMKF